ncbi:MAG: GspE/PulE family protein [Campylobacterota bacterium]
MQKSKLRLGDLLIDEGLLSDDLLQIALRRQKESDFTKKLGEVLVDSGFVSQKEIAQALAKQLKLDFVDLYGQNIDFKIISKYSMSMLKNAKAIPFGEDEDHIFVATSDPLNYDALEVLERTIATKPIKLHIALEADMTHIFDRLRIIDATRGLVENIKRELSLEGNKANGESSAIMQLINLIIKDAVKQGASDLHIEPDKHKVSVRSRVDGVLKENFVFDLDIYTALNSRIKILGNLDISEKRKAQDGRFRLQVEGGDYDFRLSTTPTMHGESLVMRILDQNKILLSLNDIGVEGENLTRLEELIKSPYGIVFVTGPTGSGKTTTLYAALNEVKSIENKVMTVEDPIEYELPLVQQIQTNEKVGFGYFAALKSFLRQDPDIIMVGEVRDLDTLNAAAQASLTGHLVFSTLHTNDAPSAITRMNQMGLESYLVADSLIGVVAQRLVRQNCPHCRVKYTPHHKYIRKVFKQLPESFQFYKGKGCRKCSFTGYLGRVMLCEVLKVTEDISHMVTLGKNKFDIAKKAQELKVYEPMVNDGLTKALRGDTTLEEIYRVTRG